MARNIVTERGIGRKGKDSETRGMTSPHKHNHIKSTRRARHMDLAVYVASDGEDDSVDPGKRYPAVSAPG